MKSEYENLYQQMSTNYVLLYNYGAYLNQISEYNKSNQIFNECSRYFNSSEMQLFFADNYLHLKEYARALKHADLAHDMVIQDFIHYITNISSLSKKKELAMQSE